MTGQKRPLHHKISNYRVLAFAGVIFAFLSVTDAVVLLLDALPALFARLLPLFAGSSVNEGLRLRFRPLPTGETMSSFVDGKSSSADDSLPPSGPACLMLRDERFKKSEIFPCTFVLPEALMTLLSSFCASTEPLRAGVIAFFDLL